MIILSSTTHTLELLTGSAVNVDYSVDWADITTSAFTPGNSNGQITTATTTTLVSAPAASTQRQIKRISIINISTTTAQTITLKFDVSGTERYISPTITLRPGETYEYLDDAGWSLRGPLGQKILRSQDVSLTGGEYVVRESRGGTTLKQSNTVGYWGGSLLNATAATPFGTFVNGTHGLSGSAITGGIARTGTFQIPNATTGHLLRNFDVKLATSTAISHTQFFLLDVLWINSGLTVTTTTAQNLTPAAAAARDINGTANGDGVMAGIWVTTATTNAGVITNMTISYTNESGTAGRTGTMVNFPATATVNNFWFFSLQAGDRGVRSIESVTLGTSLVTGAVSMFLARPIAVELCGDTTTVGDRRLANMLQGTQRFDPGLPIPNNAALVLGYTATTTAAQRTATNLHIVDY